jgi:Electron transfer flavoprotein FAD-binding domain
MLHIRLDYLEELFVQNWSLLVEFLVRFSLHLVWQDLNAS